jgi:hypothetical protein
VIHGGHIQNDVTLAVLNVLFDFLVNAFAVGAHLHAAAQFQYPDAGLDLIFREEHVISLLAGMRRRLSEFTVR